MTTLLIIVAVIAAIYIYGAIAFYYGFKNWVPFCGCIGTKCGPKKPSQAGS
jgi:CHASE2 domain-containing sensor protein